MSSVGGIHLSFHFSFTVVFFSSLVLWLLVWCVALLHRQFKRSMPKSGILRVRELIWCFLCSCLLSSHLPIWYDDHSEWMNRQFTVRSSFFLIYIYTYMFIVCVGTLWQELATAYAFMNMKNRCYSQYCENGLQNHKPPLKRPSRLCENVSTCRTPSHFWIIRSIFRRKMPLNY